MDDNEKLINGIIYWQNERRRRIRFWRNCGMPNHFRHFMISKEIEIIRAEGKRLQLLINKKAN